MEGGRLFGGKIVNVIFQFHKRPRPLIKESTLFKLTGRKNPCGMLTKVASTGAPIYKGGFWLSAFDERNKKFAGPATKKDVSW